MENLHIISLEESPVSGKERMFWRSSENKFRRKEYGTN